MRAAAELAPVLHPNVALPDGVLRNRFALQHYATVLLWITPHRPDQPGEPRWLSITAGSGDVVLRWTPNGEADFYGYDLLRRTDGGPAQAIAPPGLRGAAWVDAAAPRGTHLYGVRAVSTSGVTGPEAWSEAVTP